MADERMNHEESSRDILISQLKNKDQYINELAEAIDQHNDLRIYQLLGPLRYRDEINDAFNLEFGEYPFELVKDQRQELAHFLSDNLIDYLIEKFPFFYYREVEKGQFKVFFGNWWDRREIGTLDALNVEYTLDEEKLEKLEKALNIDEAGKTLNSDQINQLSAKNVELQKVVTAQTELEDKQKELMERQNNLSDKGGLFESNKIKEERQQIKEELAKIAEEEEQAAKAPEQIRNNQKQILVLSKEDTTLSFEIEALKKSFTSYSEFRETADQLYKNYLSSLLDEGQVKSNG
ncbi:hypothetical protein ACIPCB_02395 [Pediococcus pentosaceus]|jgi:hypothetical protein|uniref:Exonuclease SbcC n=1 Tax=Pediococcus pentosaceus TaxID=1255 RepID=A0A1Y0VPB0_PEDPE|nr:MULTISPECIES: hypothetical protein [Pediococcus]ANI98039.1 hypothetical protein AN278_005880 [Pediococcus pentosaceus]ARW19995.1 hypothetical protein S100892_01424 [Pediococcus pentosaceus]AVL01369.1 hypothetical protein PP40703_00500 [Pediococcus pentosaceus]AXR43326.1 hypothetical protein CKK51_04090 [Pediococcus pentosaceus]KAF0519816.1 hypothetical protein GBP31_00610 [Pediococcus pentosaceus]